MLLSLPWSAGAFSSACKRSLSTPVNFLSPVEEIGGHFLLVDLERIFSEADFFFPLEWRPPRVVEIDGGDFPSLGPRPAFPTFLPRLFGPLFPLPLGTLAIRFFSRQLLRNKYILLAYSISIFFSPRVPLFIFPISRSGAFETRLCSAVFFRWFLLLTSLFSLSFVV